MADIGQEVDYAAVAQDQTGTKAVEQAKDQTGTQALEQATDQGTQAVEQARVLALAQELVVELLNYYYQAVASLEVRLRRLPLHLLQFLLLIRHGCRGPL